MNACKLSLLVATSALALLINNVGQAQDVKQRLFNQATVAQQAADAKDARFLAPDTYTRALRAYRGAERKFAEARSLDSVQRDLDKAVKEYQKAEYVAELAQQNLGAMLKARSDAAKVEAEQYSSREWGRAESYYRQAISWHEDGRLSSAKRDAAAATKIYREAELTAIKTMYLAETGMLIKQAEKQGATRYAPLTLQKSRVLLASAETELTQNRYDTDLPRSLAREAKYEAQHAIHLTSYLKHAKRLGRTSEELILEWEAPVQQIAAAADMNATFEKGYEAPMQEVIAYIEDRNSESHELQQQIADRDDEIMALSAELEILHERLGGVASEQEDLQRRLLAQEHLRQQVKQIESTFGREEAHVFRDSNEIYIRLVGLSFESGSADISAANFHLLTKVQDAIRVFPSSQIVIAGHTDSQGGDDMNLALSESRAESVRQYLLAQMALSGNEVSAVGYGETRPVANNETPQGRAKNRRIDVRIVPNLDSVADLTVATFRTSSSD